MYGDIRQFLDDIKNNWKNIKDRIQFASNRFFYKNEFINELIFNKNFENLPKDEFINYKFAYKYYAKNRKKISLKYKGVEKKVDIPYYEIINYIKSPNTKISFNYPIPNYTLSEDITNETEIAFNKFITQRPKTQDNEVLRIKSIKKEQNEQFHFNLEKTTYFELIRTNLTLDFPLKTDNFNTLRIEDLDDNNNLKHFNDSCLINSIGVSTVLTYHKNGSFYFYMKPRKGKLGIFNNMLASISGVVEPPKKNQELTDYVSKELIRELHEETGLEINEITNNPQFKIIPLAFTRELTRGGKPQFFFLIIINEVSEKDFRNIFKKSDAKDEFKDDWFTNIKSFDDFISPEFTTNLLYALQYIKNKEKIKSNTLDLN